ncbi:MAG: hypothetical protein KatS3mg123_1667 [Burkholderiales bacterium]|nr:MAG: hypothetical protein KatS3mg123_1667 [Burkholderiales bacterium]
MAVLLSFHRVRKGAAWAALLLAACASLPEPAGGPPATMDAFFLAGRIGVRHGEEGFNGGVRWTHTPARDELWIVSPLGQAVARVTGAGGAVTLVTSEGRAYQAADAASLTREVLGWELPLGGLAYWATGRPDPASPGEARYDGAGRLMSLVQDGWEIRYLAYADEAEGRALPRTLSARRGELEIRLTIDQWARP